MDKTDPVCGMKGTIQAHGHYFCSEHCIKKYEEANGIKSHEISCPSCASHKKVPWYKERLYIITIFTIILLAVTYFVDELNPFFYSFKDYFLLIWWAILLGFIIGGIIEYFIPREYIEKYLSRHQKRTIMYAIVFGFLMSACSHGILAISMELYKKGASTSAVIAFLLASPWANLPITVLLFGFFGPKAALIIVSALIVATTTGLIYQKLEKRGMVECDKCSRGEDHPILTDFSIRSDVKRRWKNFEFNFSNIKTAFKGTMVGSWALTKMIMWWLIIGMIMAAFANAYVPHEWFKQFMGPTVIGLLVTLFFATIIEVCSEGSAPLAFEIYSQTGAFGNSFLFLMGGVMSDVTEIGLIWHNIGRKAAIFLPIITIPQVLVLAFIFNSFL